MKTSNPPEIHEHSIFESEEDAKKRQLNEYKRHVTKTLFIIAAADVAIATCLWAAYSPHNAITVDLVRATCCAILLCAFSRLARKQPKAAIWAGFAAYIATIIIAGFCAPYSIIDNFKAIIFIICIFLWRA